MDKAWGLSVKSPQIGSGDDFIFSISRRPEQPLILKVVQVSFVLESADLAALPFRMHHTEEFLHSYMSIRVPLPPVIDRTPYILIGLLIDPAYGSDRDWQSLADLDDWLAESDEVVVGMPYTTSYDFDSLRSDLQERVFGRWFTEDDKRSVSDEEKETIREALKAEVRAVLPYHPFPEEAFAPLAETLFEASRRRAAGEPGSELGQMRVCAPCQIAVMVSMYSTFAALAAASFLASRRRYRPDAPLYVRVLQSVAIALAATFGVDRLAEPEREREHQAASLIQIMGGFKILWDLFARAAFEMCNTYQKCD